MKERFVSGSELARMADVSRQAVSEAKKGGRLIRDEATQRYDLRHPTNLLFLEQALADRGIQSDDEASDGDATLRELKIEKLEAEIARTQAQEERLAIQNAASRRELVPASMVAEMAGAFASGGREYLLQLPQRIASRLVATVRSGGDEQNVRDVLEEEIGDSISRALAMGEQATERLLDEWPSTQEGDEDDAE